MYKIDSHPILEIPQEDLHEFLYEGRPVKGQKGQTIAAALHQAGFPVHHHSLKDRKRTMECGIGKCGACEMLVDGHIRRICITKVDGVREVRSVGKESFTAVDSATTLQSDNKKVYRTAVAIIGAGPAGLAVR
jgi:succinate dehydrogenase/fumarate reductase-like Fe-S protein